MTSTEKTLKNLLLVEDDQEIAEMMSICLEDLGFEVQSAGDGLEAIQKLQSGRFDMVVSDLKMPKLDGLGLARYISEKYQNLPIVLLSGFVEESVRETARMLGVKKLLDKPTSPLQLQQEIQESWQAMSA